MRVDHRNRVKHVMLTLLVAVSGCVDEPRAQPRALSRDTSVAAVVASAVPRWTAAQRWRVSAEPAVRIEFRDETPEQSPLDPVSVFRVGSGEIVVADGNQIGWQRLLVYNERGEFVRHLGRKGDGPCEFGQVWRAWPFVGDSVAVFHMGRGVVVMSINGGCGRPVLMPTGELTPSRRRRGVSMGGVVGMYPDGTILLHPMGYVPDSINTGLLWYEHDLQRVDREGRLVRSLGLFPIMQTWRTQDGGQRWIRLNRVAVRALDGFDLLFGDAGSFEILRIDTTGTVRRIMRRP